MTFLPKSVDAVYKHYNIKHGQRLSGSNTIHDIHREFCPHDYPDLDMNQQFGLLFTRQNVVTKDVDKRIASYSRNLSKVPATIYHDVRDICDDYRDAFFNFFGADVISLHGHVSDASSPHTLTSLILHLRANASQGASKKKATPAAFKLSEIVRGNPCVAVMEGSYGTGFGSLAYNAPYSWSADVACGSRPVVVKMDPAQKIEGQIKEAKRRGCVLFLVEIVRSRDGAVMTPDQWFATIQACKKRHIMLVVDEAMTAIRCGAPFAHQLSQYKKHGRPDLILFGKGVKTNGVAVDWQGINVHQLGIAPDKERNDAVIMWLKRFTEAAKPEALLESWGTISLAQQQNWPQRSVNIGQTLRNILLDFHVHPSSISGLHSLIWLRRNDSALDPLAVMSANAGLHYTRWLPLMDAVMADEEELKNKVFGLGSHLRRKQLAAYMVRKNWWHGYCSRCGDAIETGEDREEVREVHGVFCEALR